MTVEELAEQLRKALAHLEDPIYLETLPLLDLFYPEMQNGGMSRGQALRRELRLAIDALTPCGNGPHTELDTRAHEVLYHYAVSRLRVGQIANRMGISDRQTYRELRRATNALATVLYHKYVEPSQHQASEPSAAPEPMYDDVERISHGVAESIDVAQLLSTTVCRLSPLTRAHHVDIVLEGGLPVVSMSSSRAMMHHALLSLISHLVAHAEHNTKLVIGIDVKRAMEHVVRLDVVTTQELQDANPQSPYAISADLFARMGVHIQLSAVDNRTKRVELHLPRRSAPSVLIIDDNEDLLALFRRYLSRHDYRVHEVDNIDDGLLLVGRVAPDVVILDIMMPDRDGWELLQTLRTTNDSRQPKVIVCSIIEDPGLASALGADAFLKKPVARADLLSTLQAVLSELPT